MGVDEDDFFSSGETSVRRRGIDRRRETSRYAARDRRGKEADIFLDLKDEVPLVEDILQQCNSELEPANVNEEEMWSETSLSECLDGFVLLADTSGMILYVSESVYIFLGLTQTDFIGRTLNFKSALYKAIICRCRFIANAGIGGQITLIHGCSSPAGQGNQPSITGSPLSKGNEAASGVYMTRHTCDMKFTYVSDSLNYLLCQQSNKSLLGTSFYDLVHPADLTPLVTSFKELFRKGHCRTNYYRFLGANGAVVWAQTEATTVNHTTKGQRGQYILGVHSILGYEY
ncbi:PAS domain-containing protein [Ditylenchus destructor]|nr:PAS domain-containing protein [Ditylenchus destructor]